MISKLLKKYFIPHEENDYKPHALQKAAVVGMMLLILISFSLVNLQSIFWISSEWLVSTVLPAVIIDETNQERSDAALPTLQHSEALDAAAQMKAEDMARGQYFSHTSPSGLSPWYWFERVDYAFIHAGENLAVHFTDSSDVVEAWMNSPSHRKNIMDSKFTEIGIGTAQGSYEGYDTVFVVQLFGTPSQSSVPVSQTVSTVDESEVSEIVSETVAGASADTQINVTDDDTVVYSSYMSTTSANALPVAQLSESVNAENVTPVSGEEVRPQSVNKTTTNYMALATQPQMILQMFYLVISLFVVTAIILSTVIEVRRQQPVQIMYGTGLVAVMALLLYLHMTIASGVVIA